MFIAVLADCLNSNKLFCSVCSANEDVAASATAFSAKWDGKQFSCLSQNLGGSGPTWKFYDMLMLELDKEVVIEEMA